ncbi:MAG: cation-transporting P-type ATPase, partial [Cyanobacteria bacterium J06631_2]
MNPSASDNSFNTPTNNKDWHTVGAQQAVEILKSNAEAGLTNDEVIQKQKYFGKNELKQTGGRSKL